jgi:hypothetical protein
VTNLRPVEDVQAPRNNAEPVASKLERYVETYRLEPQGEPDLWGDTNRVEPAFADLDADPEDLPFLNEKDMK